MTAYRIRDWSKHFENNRTRELKELRFVILPNKHDGDGYTELLDHPNGAAHYGAWVAMVQVASKCDVRGTLMRDGDRPHDPASLSRLTRLPEKVFKEAIPRLVQVGWIEPLPEHNQSDSTIPQEGATLNAASSRNGLPKSAPEQNGIEGNGIEEKRESLAAQARRVFSFWQEHLNHPRSVFDEKRAKAVTARLKAGYSVDDLMTAIQGCKNTPYNMGQNPEQKVYDDIELICRDAAHVERFMSSSNGSGMPRSRTLTEQFAAGELQ